MSTCKTEGCENEPFLDENYCRDHLPYLDILEAKRRAGADI